MYPTQRRTLPMSRTLPFALAAHPGWRHITLPSIIAGALMFIGCSSPDGQATFPGQPQHPEGAAQPPPIAVDAHASCAALTIVEDRTLCLLEAALHAGEHSTASSASSLCQSIEPDLWRDECHFQVAEVLGLGGDLAAGLASCGQARRFETPCIIHWAWWARPFQLTLEPSDPDAWRAIATVERELEPALAQLQPRLSSQAQRQLRASLWFELIYGSGDANPTAARAAPDDHSASARTAFAAEAVRLLGAQVETVMLPRAVEQAWHGQRQIPQGAPIRPECWSGRILDPVPAEQLRDGPVTPTVHGGLRRSSDDDDDLAIATIEAIFFHQLPGAPATLEAALAGDSPSLRWTAARLLPFVAPENPGPTQPPEVRAVFEAARALLGAGVDTHWGEPPPGEVDPCSASTPPARDE